VKLEELVSSPVLEVQERASSALQVGGVANSLKFRRCNFKGTEQKWARQRTNLIVFLKRAKKEQNSEKNLFLFSPLKA
jgi:hypothetical protein